jgi:hypothetical protein
LAEQLKKSNKQYKYFNNMLKDLLRHHENITSEAGAGSKALEDRVASILGERVRYNLKLERGQS